MDKKVERVKPTHEEKRQLKRSNAMDKLAKQFVKALRGKDITRFETLLNKNDNIPIDMLLNDHDKPLIFSAIELGNTEAIKILVNRGITVDSGVPFLNDNCFTVAAKKEDIELMKLLIDKLDRADKDKGSFCSKMYYILSECRAFGFSRSDFEKYNCPLSLAFQSGNRQLSELLLDNCDDINNIFLHPSYKEYFESIISNQPKSTFETTVEILINYGLSNNTYFGMKVFQHAIDIGCVNTVNLLIKYGINIANYSKPPGISCYLVAVDNYDVNMLNVLLENRSFLAIPNHFESEAILSLTRSIIYDLRDNSGLQTCKQIMQTLIHYGGDINYRDPFGDTAISLLSSSPYDTSELVEILITHGANINWVYREGKSLILYSCYNGYGHINVIKLLLSKGSRVSELDLRILVKRTTGELNTFFQKEFRWRAVRQLLLIKKKSTLFSNLPNDLVRKTAGYLKHEDWNTFFNITGRRR